MQDNVLWYQSMCIGPEFYEMYRIDYKHTTFLVLNFEQFLDFQNIFHSIIKRFFQLMILISILSSFLSVYSKKSKRRKIYCTCITSDALNFEVNKVVTQYCVYFEIWCIRRYFNFLTPKIYMLIQTSASIQFQRSFDKLWIQSLVWKVH